MVNRESPPPKAGARCRQGRGGGGPGPARKLFTKCTLPLDKRPIVWYIIVMLSELDRAKEDMAMRLFGRSRVLAIAGKGCVKCGEAAVTFKDELSKKEFGISGLCQVCQDGIFG